MKKNYRLNENGKKILFTILIFFLILFMILLNLKISYDMESHIQRVSKKCSQEGYGIVANFTKQGDKYYVCNK